jgi:hypothetical protein
MNYNLWLYFWDLSTKENLTQKEKERLEFLKILSRE